VKKGHVRQRHARACPRDEEGELLTHRCRGTWGYVIDAGRHADGRRRQSGRDGFTTKRAAQQALDEEMTRQQAGIRPDGSLTVADFLDEWLVGKRNLRETTRTSYGYLIRLYLKPALGHHMLQDLRADHLDALYADLLSARGAGKSPAVVHHVHRTLRSALNTAMKRRLIQWNPALQVELPEHRAARTTIWEPAHIARFLDGSREHRLSALFHLMVFTGMRRGEAIGLHWADVDLDRSQISIRWQVTDPGDGPRLTSPKTAAGVRTVPIDRASVDVLRRHRGAQEAERASWGSAWTDNGLVFTRENGDLLRPDGITHLFGQLLQRVDVPRIRLHDLRHTHASLALAAGVDVKVVSDRLGHSTTHITANLYTHVVPALARSAADAIAAAVAYTQRVDATDVGEMLATGEGRATGRDPPVGKAPGQRGRPRGARTHNPRIKSPLL